MAEATTQEEVQLKDLEALAKVLRGGNATPHDRDTSSAVMIELYIAQRRVGTVTPPECKEKRDLCAKSKPWGLAKAVSVFGSVATVCLTILQVTGHLA